MSLCILTISSALFPPTLPHIGRFVHTLPLLNEAGGILLPGVEDFIRIYAVLGREFNTILVLLGAETILPCIENARQAAQSHGGTAKIEVLDTMQFGPGLGILVQLAAKKALAGMAFDEVKEYIRSVIPYMFTILCPEKIPAYNGGEEEIKPLRPHEPAGNLPVYSLEEGQFSPYKRVRTQRHLLETFQEFLEEFEKPQQFAYFHGKNASLHFRPLREAASGLFPEIHFNEFELNATLTELFGERTVGLTVLELPCHAQVR
jgi:fatty acid-binding protein DegV